MLARTIQLFVLIALVATTFAVWGGRWETYIAGAVAIGLALSSDTRHWTRWHDGINPATWLHDLGHGLALVFGGTSRAG
jgi:hypothetical protein